MNEAERLLFAEQEQRGLPDAAMIIQACETRGVRQKYVAGLYAWCLRFPVLADSEWPLINQAIVDRWTLSGLKRIKRAAWAAIEQAETA